MKIADQSNNKVIADLKNFLKTVEPLIEKITQLPRGPWQIKFEAGYDRSLFVNKEVTELDYEVDFAAVRTALDDFFDLEVKASDQLKLGFKSLAYAVGKSNSLEAAGESINSALSALNDYKVNMKTHPGVLMHLETALSQSLENSRKAIQTYLQKQPAGKKVAIKIYEGFESQIQQTIAHLKQIIGNEIPEKYSEGLAALTAAQKAFS